MGVRPDKAPILVDMVEIKPAPNASKSAVKEIYYLEGIPRCSARKSYCTRCGFQYDDPDEPMACPTCGHVRACLIMVSEAGLRCIHHGGKSLVGPAAPNWKGGTRSDYLPARYRERYKSFYNDGELLNIRRDVALLESRISDRMENVDNCESGFNWQEAQKAYRGFREAVKNKDNRTMAFMLDRLEEYLGDGVSDAAAWNEIYDIIERRRKLIESEMKRLEKMGSLITVDDLMEHTNRIAELARRTIKDPQDRNDFIRALAKLLD